MMAVSSKVGSWLGSFNIEGTKHLLKEHFSGRLQRLALLEMDEELRSKERSSQNAAKGFHMVQAASASHVGGGGRSKEDNEVENGTRAGGADSGAQPTGAGGDLNDRGKVKARDGMVKNGRTKYRILRVNSVVRTGQTENES